MSTTEVVAGNPRGHNAVLACGVLTGLTAVCIAARLGSRFFLVKNPGFEEGVISVAWIFSMIFTVCVAKEVYFGLGRNLSTLSPSDIEGFSMWFWVSIWTYNLSLTSTKFSILLQYKRIFVTDWFKKSLTVMLVVIGLYGLATFGDTFFICWPISFYWKRTGNGKCVQSFPMFYANSALNIVTDLMLFLAPMPVLRSLKVPTRQKFALIGVFAIGILVCGISVWRFYDLHTLNNSTNWSYDNITPAIWSSIEINMGIMSASLPAVKPLIVRVFPCFGSGESNKGSSYGGRWSTSKKQTQGTQNTKARAEKAHMSVLECEISGDELKEASEGITKEVSIEVREQYDVER